MQKRLAAYTLLTALSIFGSTVCADPLEKNSRVSIGPFTYSIDSYLSSTPALLVGLDAGYDHGLHDGYGLRFRAGAVILGIDEISGVAWHGEAGVYRRIHIGHRINLEGALLGGIHFGGLDHKGAWKDRTGPTLMAELSLPIAITDHLEVSLAAGYRVARTASVGWSGESDDFATGPVIRASVGWTF